MRRHYSTANKHPDLEIVKAKILSHVISARDLPVEVLSRLWAKKLHLEPRQLQTWSRVPEEVNNAPDQAAR